MESAKVESESTTRRWPSWICKSLFLLDIMFVLGGIVPINLPKSPWKKYSVYFCCLVITCLHTANTIRILIVLEPEETFSLSWLLRSINIISYGTGTLFSILHKMKAGKIREYFDCVTNLENTFQVLPTDVKRKVRRALIISTVVFCIFGIFSVATNFYMLSNVGYNPLFVFLASPLPPNHRYAKTLGYIVSAYGPLLNAAWMAPMFLYVVMCYIICQGFNQVSKKFERLAEAKKIGNELEELRKHHETMCSMVEAADDAISCYVGICSAETILFVCIMLYTVAKTPEDLIIVSMMAFGLIYMMVNVLCLMIGGIFVNEKAHSLKNQLFRMEMLQLDFNIKHTLTIFLMRLNGHPIGITVMKFFVIDRTSVLTIVGTVVTYAVVVFQFPSAPASVPSQSLPQPCNSTLLNNTA